MSIEITLFNPGPYYPGQTIVGKVVCVFTSSINIRGIRLKLRGQEHTSWDQEESYTDDETKETKYRTVQYTGDNNFLEFQENLAGQGTQNPGRYEFPYQFILPKTLPGTYSSSYGRIFYSMKANVDIPMGIDYEDEKIFHVMSLVDLNEISNPPLNPIQLQDEKTICCWCCADGPITMDVYLERGLFVLGETIKLRIEVTNMSNESLDQMKVELKNNIEERTNSPTTDKKYTEALLASLVETGVGAHGNRTFAFDLLIPPNTELPNFETCTLFKQYCELKIEASLPGPHTNMKVTQKIKLGHIPPRRLGGQLPQQFNSSGEPVPPYVAGQGVNQSLYPTVPGWVMPPGEDGNAPSAPSKAELAAGIGSFEPQNGAGSTTDLSPPSYNDAVNPRST